MGKCNGDGDNYAIATVECKRWHIGVDIGHHNVEGYLDCILYGDGLERWHLTGGEQSSRGGGVVWDGGEKPLPLPLPTG